MTVKRIIVIGGGITGLAAAWRLRQDESVNVLLLEASGRVGGSIASESRDGFLLERGPDCFISDKPAGMECIRALGLEPELIDIRSEHRRSFIWRAGRLHPVPEGFYLLGPAKLRPFLESSLLGWRAKWRALLEPLMPRGRGDDESLASFVRRRFGPEMLDWFAQPLLGGIYGADPEQLSLQATFPQFLEMEQKYGSVLLGLKKRSALSTQHSALSTASGARYSLFRSFRRGMQTLPDELYRRLGTSVVRLNAKAASLSRTSSEWTVLLATGEKLSADGVVLALPSFASASLIQPFDPTLAEDLADISSAPAATINFAFREKDIPRSFSGAGFVVPQREAKTLLGATFVENKFEGRVPKGFLLLRAFVGGVFSHRALGQSDEILVRQTLDELQSMLAFKAAPLFHVLSRYAEGLPQYTLGHVKRVLRIEERALRHKGLALAGNWARGVGIPDCIQSANHAYGWGQV